jgi:hypothetical protein
MRHATPPISQAAVLDKTAPVNYTSTIIGCIVNGLHHSLNPRKVSFCLPLCTNLQQHHGNVPIDSCHTDSIVAFCTYDSHCVHRMKVGSNAAPVHPIEYMAIRVRAFEGKIPTHYVIDITIFVVVRLIRFFGEAILVGPSLTGVMPDVVSDVWVVIAEAVI